MGVTETESRSTIDASQHAIRQRGAGTRRSAQKYATVSTGTRTSACELHDHAYGSTRLRYVTRAGVAQW